MSLGWLMTQAKQMPSIDALIRAGGATLAFDTNAIIGFSGSGRRLTFSAFFDFCDAVDRLREEARDPLAISVVVPTLAYIEALHDLRTSLGATPFDRGQVERTLARKKVVVAAFDGDTAMSASAVLHRWFPSHDEWRLAKRARCLEVLCLRDAPGQSGLATIDWVIAAQAEAAGWVLVTSDAGAEFAHVTRKVKRDELRRVIDVLLRERGL